VWTKTVFGQNWLSQAKMFLSRMGGTPVSWDVARMAALKRFCHSKTAGRARGKITLRGQALADLKLAGENQPLQAADAGVFQALDFDGFEGSWHDGSGDCPVKPPAIDSSIAHYGEKYKQDLSVSV
jgi:hypothetical protein